MSGSKTMVYLHNGILNSRKKEGTPTFRDHMDGEYYVKSNKPGGERQIPDGLIYKRNLKNTTNKQANYNQRH